MLLIKFAPQVQLVSGMFFLAIVWMPKVLGRPIHRYNAMGRDIPLLVWHLVWGALTCGSFVAYVLATAVRLYY